jgi:hypothetical protein
MHESSAPRNVVVLDTSVPVWDQFFTVAPLVLIGTRDDDGSIDFAPKHMVTPLGWQNYFGFVCTPRHSTCRNIERTGEFTVSYPKPSQVLTTSLAASPRCETGSKPVIGVFHTFAAQHIDGQFIERPTRMMITSGTPSQTIRRRFTTPPSLLILLPADSQRSIARMHFHSRSP